MNKSVHKYGYTMYFCYFMNVNDSKYQSVSKIFSSISVFTRINQFKLIENVIFNEKNLQVKTF